MSAEHNKREDCSFKSVANLRFVAQTNEHPLIWPQHELALPAIRRLSRLCFLSCLKQTKARTKNASTCPLLMIVAILNSSLVPLMRNSSIPLINGQMRDGPQEAPHMRRSADCLSGRSAVRVGSIKLLLKNQQRQRAAG